MSGTGIMKGVGQFLRIEADGTLRALTEASFSDETLEEVEAGSLTIVRFVVFGEEAKQMLGGQPGRWEKLEAESEVDEDEMDAEGKEPEIEWTTNWEPV